LADPTIGGGQRVMTFSDKPLSIQQVLDLLVGHLGLQELCRAKQVDLSVLADESGGATLTGFDGPRRVPIRGDAGLITFLAGAACTNIPSVEVQLPRPPARKPVPPAEDRTAGARVARDSIEKKEDVVFRLQGELRKLERRCVEMERMAETNKEEARRMVDVARRDFQKSQDDVVKQFDAKVDLLNQKDAEILADLDVVRKHGFAVEKQDNDHHEEMKQALKDLDERVQEQFQEVDDQIQDLRNTDDMLQKEDERQQGELDQHLAELKRLEDVKVDKSLWKKHEDEMDARITREVAELSRRLQEAEEDLNMKITEARRVQKADHKQICDTVEELRKENDAEHTRIETKLDDGLREAENALARVRQEVLKDTETKVGALSEKTEAHFTAVKQEVANRDAAVNTRVDDLVKKCETTFKAIDERMEEHARVERARFGQIEKDLVDSTTRLRADCRSEVERCRQDYEKEAARLDADLGDMHMKQDVTKQEMTFVQSKLLEQREWSQRQLTEVATAMRAVQVDSQEGLAATTKMLHALRDDAVAFREKMAKYVSLLQHSSDSQGDALTALEAQRGRIRTDLDSLIGDHKAYTVDMDSWADDVRTKVERLFRAMEPARVEWKVCRAHKRAKELKKPLAVKSPVFSLRGLREVQLEFFPEGTHSSPEGKAILRVYMPKGVHIRYQMWIGFSTEGPMEIKPGGSLSADMAVEEWRNQIQEDGSLPVVLEVIRDLANEDESLSREVRVESP